MKELSLQSDTAIKVLYKKLSLLESTVDSLQESVKKTEIGQSYFSDIVNLQLTSFVLIVSLVGLISWGGIVFYLKRKIRKQVRLHKKIIADLEKTKVHSLGTEVQVFKAMFFICYEAKNWTGALTWCIRLIELYVENPVIEVSENSNKKEWVFTARSCLNKGIGKEDIKSYILIDIDRVISKSSLIEDASLREQIDEFKKELSMIIYS